MTFAPEELEYLRSQRLGRLATVQPDGTLQVNPVGYHVDATRGFVDIGGRNMAASRKFRNVADNGRVAFVVDDIASVDPWVVRCLEIRGDAEALTDPGDTRAYGDGPVIRIRPRRIIGWGLGADGRYGTRRTIA